MGNVKRRRIGRSELTVAPLILGGNTFGWTVDRADAFNILDAFVDAGYDAIDTADVYSAWVEGHAGGESETLIGEWLAARRCRSRIVLASKVGGVMHPYRGGLSAQYIIDSIEQSLRRLRTDYLDLYQSHADDPSTPIDETLEAYQQLIRAGKVRAIGASHHTSERVQEIAAVSREQGLPRYDSIQPRYNLIDRAEFERDLQRTCIDLEIGALAYSSLAKGFLTGVYQVERRGGHEGIWSGMVKQRYANERGFRVLAEMERIAAEAEAAPVQVALRWLISQPAVAAPIVGVESVAQLRELIGYEEISLTSAHLATLSAAGAP